jgi:hypothetical protein
MNMKKGQPVILMLYESNFGSGPTLHDVYPMSLLYVVKVVKWYYAGWNLVDRQQRESSQIAKCGRRGVLLPALSLVCGSSQA